MPRSELMLVTVYGVCAVTFMMVMYALEARHRGYVLAFAAGCLLSSAYGFASGAWPFGIVELIWAAIAVRRFRWAGRPAVRGGRGLQSGSPHGRSLLR